MSQPVNALTCYVASHTFPLQASDSFPSPAWQLSICPIPSRCHWGDDQGATGCVQTLSTSAKSCEHITTKQLKKNKKNNYVPTYACAYLQHFIQVLDFCLLVLLQRDVVFFKLQILRVKCLQKREEGGGSLRPNVRPKQPNQLQ